MEIDDIITKMVKFGIVDVEDQHLEIDNWNLRISNEFRLVFNTHLKENNDFGLSFIKTMENMVKERTDFHTFSIYCKLIYEAIQLEIELNSTP